jgi:hypothetical protein
MVPQVTDMVQYYIGQNVSISGTNLIPSGTGNAALEALRVSPTAAHQPAPCCCLALPACSPGYRIA